MPNKCLKLSSGIEDSNSSQSQLPTHANCRYERKSSLRCQLAAACSASPKFPIHAGKVIRTWEEYLERFANPSGGQDCKMVYLLKIAKLRFCTC